MDKKNVHFENLVFVIYQLKYHTILKILVSTPHNYPLIMGGRHKNLSDWMIFELIYYENKIVKMYVFFFIHALYTDNKHKFRLMMLRCWWRLLPNIWNNLNNRIKIFCRKGSVLFLEPPLLDPKRSRKKKKGSQKQ